MKVIFVFLFYLVLWGQEGLADKPCGCGPLPGLEALAWPERECTGVGRGACTYYNKLGDCKWYGHCPGGDDDFLNDYRRRLQGEWPIHGDSQEPKAISPECVNWEHSNPELCSTLDEKTCKFYEDTRDCRWIGPKTKRMLLDERWKTSDDPQMCFITDEHTRGRLLLGRHGDNCMFGSCECSACDASGKPDNIRRGCEGLTRKPSCDAAPECKWSAWGRRRRTMGQNIICLKEPCCKCDKCDKKVKQECESLPYASCARAAECNWESSKDSRRRIASPSSAVEVAVLESEEMQSSRRRLSGDCGCKYEWQGIFFRCKDRKYIELCKDLGQVSCERYTNECNWTRWGRRLAEEKTLDVPALPSTRRRLQCCEPINKDFTACDLIKDHEHDSCKTYAAECNWTCRRRLADETQWEKIPTRRRITTTINTKNRCHAKPRTAPNEAQACETIMNKATCLIYADVCDWSELFDVNTANGARRLSEGLEVISAKISEVVLDAVRGTAKVPLRRRLDSHCIALIDGGDFLGECNGIPVKSSCEFYTHDCAWVAKDTTNNTEQPSTNRRLIDMSGGMCIPARQNDSAEVSQMCNSMTNDVWSCLVYNKYDECKWDVLKNFVNSQTGIRLAKAADSFPP